MRYYVTNGLQFITKKATLTLNQSEAGLWERDKAVRVCNATKQNKYKRRYIWFLVNEDELSRSIINEDITAVPFEVFVASHPSRYDIHQYSLMLNERYREVTAVITDLYHIIELKDADIQEKLKLYDELQDALKQRREFKDNLTILMQIFTRDKDLEIVEEQLLNRVYRFRSEQFCNSM